MIDDLDQVQWAARVPTNSTLLPLSTFNWLHKNVGNFNEDWSWYDDRITRCQVVVFRHEHDAVIFRLKFRCVNNEN